MDISEDILIVCREYARLRVLHTNMVSRCYNVNGAAFKNYGGRGIKVCDEWLVDKEKFIVWCLQNGSSKGLELDRIDTDGNYCPENCRFVTPLVNNRNRRNTVWVSAFGETKPLGAWASDTRCVVSVRTLHHRIFLCKWTTEDAITTPSTRSANTCIRGHEYTPENTYLRKNSKMCKRCHSLQQSKRYHEKKANEGIK